MKGGVYRMLTYQKDSGQQMGKDTRAGRNSSHHIQLALFPRYIACMDCRGHHLFQGTLQVPLPYSLFSRGIGNHSVHTEFSGLLKSDDMEHARNLSLQHKGAVRERAALFVSVTAGNDTERKREWTENTDIGKPRTTGQSWQTLLVGRQGQAASGFGKNHPRCAPVFFPKTLPFRKHLPLGPCSSTGCQSPGIHS